MILIFGISGSPDDSEGLGFIEGAWQSLMATLDSGTMGGDEGWPFRAVRFVATLIGIFLISVLIGAISSAIDGKIEELKMGRTPVLEEQHTLVLGWSEKIISIVRELVIANENQKRPAIVILSDRDKVEAEEELRSKVGDLRNTRLVVRSGNPLDGTDLAIVNPNAAKSVIVLSPDEENADIHVIKTVLGLTRGKGRKEEPFSIVAEIRDEANMEAAELVGNNETLFVRSEEIISRITAQTCLQSGLSVVYSELLCFEGDEMYFSHQPALNEKTYGDALVSFRDSSLIGLLRNTGEVLINPPMHTRIESGDRVIAITADDDTIVVNGRTDGLPAPRLMGKPAVSGPRKVNTMLLGWNENGPRIISELDHYVAPGSRVFIVARLTEEDLQHITDTQAVLQNIALDHRVAEISERKSLESLGIASFQNIIVLSYRHMDVQESDAKTLICLLHLRNLCEQHDQNFNIVTEMLDLKNRELGVVAKADDFIVGDNLISLLLSQLSENPDLKRVYDELFRAEGSEIYLKPADRYIQPGQSVDFYTIVANAASLGETAIGYRLQALSEDMDRNFGVKINPNKDETVTLGANDFVIVLSED